MSHETKKPGRPPKLTMTPERTKYTLATDLQPPLHARNLRARDSLKFNYANPCLILTAGPTGSGKSDLTKMALELLYSTKGLPKCKKFLVDDLVETSDLYKKKVDDIITKFGCDKSVTSGKCDLKNPSTALLNEFEEAYMSTRKDGPCNSVIPESCNDVFKKRIKIAIEEGRSISIETTGSKIPIDYIKLFDISKYNIVFVYSMVNFGALLGRNTNRAAKNMTSYLSDRTRPGPRLPDVSEKQFKKATSVIIQTIIQLRNICLRLGRPPVNKCGPISNGIPYTLLIYDNDGPSKQLVYNSRTSDDFMTDAEFVTFISRYQLDTPYISTDETKKKSNTNKSKSPGKGGAWYTRRKKRS